MNARLVLALSVSAAALWPAGCGQEDRPDPADAAKRPRVLADRTWPNVVLIVIDSLRPDHLGCYGYQRPTSPRIDRLAGEGALFECVVSSSGWTLPAHATLFTGLCDSVHGCTDTDRRLHEKHYTLAERLRDTGYATAGFFSGPYLHPVFGLNQGFETYVDCTSYAELSDRTAAESGTVEGEAIWDAMHRDVTNPTVVARVRQWLHDNRRRPFFLFVHMWDVHFDFLPPPPYDTLFDPGYAGPITGAGFLVDDRINKDMPRRDLDHLIALYDGEIAWTDAHLGQLLDELAALGLLENSLLVVTADHGTAFFEHQLKGHRNSLYDEVIRIPLLVRWPPRIPPGLRIRQQVRMIDLLPTIVDLIGAAWDYRTVMGHSLAALFSGGQLPRDDPAISELSSMGIELQAFRRLERKTIWHVALDKGVVFDLLADPGELAPLTDRNAPAVVAARQDVKWSRGFLELFRARHPPAPAISDLPKQLLEKLRSLGYVGEEAATQPEASPP